MARSPVGKEPHSPGGPPTRPTVGKVPRRTSDREKSEKDPGRVDSEVPQGTVEVLGDPKTLRSWTFGDRTGGRERQNNLKTISVTTRTGTRRPCPRTARVESLPPNPGGTTADEGRPPRTSTDRPPGRISQLESGPYPVLRAETVIPFTIFRFGVGIRGTPVKVRPVPSKKGRRSVPVPSLNQEDGVSRVWF